MTDPIKAENNKPPLIHILMGRDYLSCEKQAFVFAVFWKRKLKPSEWDLKYERFIEFRFTLPKFSLYSKLK